MVWNMGEKRYKLCTNNERRPAYVVFYSFQDAATKNFLKGQPVDAGSGAGREKGRGSKVTEPFWVAKKEDVVVGCGAEILNA